MKNRVLNCQIIIPGGLLENEWIAILSHHPDVERCRGRDPSSDDVLYPAAFAQTLPQSHVQPFRRGTLSLQRIRREFFFAGRMIIFLTEIQVVFVHD